MYNKVGARHLISLIALSCASVACSKNTGFKPNSGSTAAASVEAGNNSDDYPKKNPPPQVETYKIENTTVRYCSPGKSPGIYSSDSSFGARELVIRISKATDASDRSPLLAGSISKAEEDRTIIFESPLLTAEQGVYHQLAMNSFLTNIPASVHSTLMNAPTQAYVITLEEKNIREVLVPGTFGVGEMSVQGHLVYGSTLGSVFPNPVPTEHTQNPLTIQAAKLSYQMTIIYKSGYNNSENTRENGCEEIVDPLVIDFSNLGIQTSNDYVEFDISNSGKATRMGWLANNSNQAFLVHDSNQNGIVDSGAEMFSNYTRIAGGYAANGFEALAQYDHISLGGNNDGVIDPKDSIYSKLLLWFDRNHNGMTDSGELVSLHQLGVNSFSLTYTTERIVDHNGHQVLGQSEVTLSNGQTRKIYDVWFKPAP